MAVWICSAVSTIFVLMFIISFKYRAEERKHINRKKNKLWFLYGMAMFLADKPFRRITARNMHLLDSKFKSLYVKERVEKEKYIYVVSKVSLVILVVFISACVGVTQQVLENEADKKVSELIRNEYGDGDKSYILDADDKTTKEEIEIAVPQQEISDTEALDIFEKYKKELLEEVLGENESQDKVTKPLNLLNMIGKENIQISWEIENDKIIGYDGSIGEGVEKKGTLARLYATMSLENVSVTQEIVLHVYPSEGTKAIQEIVQKIVNNYDAYEEKIPLPVKVNGRKITFSEKTEEYSMVILLIGLAAAIAIFFLKDKDMDKDMEERNTQLVLDYPEVVNKIMILNRAGMSMRKAWERTIESAGGKKNHYVYREMKMTLLKINGGISEMSAYEQFGKRCGLHCYIRFSNIICQNLRRGSSEMYRALECELRNALQEKKNNALKLGEQVGTKLLAPMVIMLVVGLVLIVAPAFMSVKF